jgi:putative hydrolase of HD superfamily
MIGPEDLVRDLKGDDVSEDGQLHGVATFLFEMGHLKRSKRTGWWLAGIDNPESVAEHSHRTALIAALLAMLEGADPGRAALLALFHDTQESRTGDIPSVGKVYLRQAEHEAISADQVGGFPKELGRAVLELVAEYEARESFEARIARDADKLECLLQAREYQVQGYTDVPPWIATSAAAIRSESARELARLAQELPPSTWWRSFVASVYTRQGLTPPGEPGN